MSIDSLEKFEQMKKIGAIVANCLEMMKSQAQPGISTLELDELAARFLEQHGAISAPKSTYRFPGTTCISVEREAAHGIPGTRIIQAGDLINIDVSAHLDGYYADNGESFVVGGDKTRGPQAIKTKLVKVVHAALQGALSKARAGAKISELGKEVERIAQKNQLTVVRNLGGHGVGTSLHEEPKFIASYYDRHDRRVLTENLVVAIEPFVSNGATWIEEAADGWTLHHPQFFSAQKEHTVMITKDRPFIFTRPTRKF